MLLVGFALGAASMWLFLDTPMDTDFGSGIKTLVEGSRHQTDARAVAQKGPEELPEPASPKFDFYTVLPTVLPEIERIIPDDEEPVAEAPPEPRSTAARKTEKVVGYVLQVGSYTRYGDADQMKAQLALSGIVAHIQKVSIEGRGVFYRVRVGPFENLENLSATDQRLRSQGVRAIRLKVTQPTTG